MIRRTARHALALSALALLAGCAAATPPVRVTRFSTGRPAMQGSVAIVARDPAAANSLSFNPVAGAVAAEMARIGFRPGAPQGGADYLAVVDLGQVSRPGPPTGPQFSIGLGGASFGRHTGIGGGVEVPVSRGRESLIDSSLLSVQLRRRADGAPLWEGRATTETRAGTPADDPAALARRLAAALFRDYPGASGQTITVK